MNTYNITDPNIINSTVYKQFINNNPVYGYLNIRAFAASQAIPISDLKIVVDKQLNGYNVIFFEGYTDSSGVIENITLPAPIQDPNNLDAPNYTAYKITATYPRDNITRVYTVNIYENLLVIQNINLVPNMNPGFMGDINGS